jgi:hypothetical protein
MVSRWRQFDVFANPDKRSAANHPYLVILQSEAVTGIETCVVAPLASPRSIKFFERLLPEITVKGARYALLTPNMAAIRTEKIGKPVANLEAERYRILAAIDLVFVGI